MPASPEVVQTAAANIVDLLSRIRSVNTVNSGHHALRPVEVSFAADIGPMLAYYMLMGKPLPKLSGDAYVSGHGLWYPCCVLLMQLQRSSDTGATAASL